MPNIKQIKTPNNITYDILDANAYHVNDTEETNKDNLNNDDFIPFYETSGTAAPKKMKVSNLINRLKTLLGLGTASTRAYTTSVTQNSDDLVTSGAVWTAIDELPEPMVFRGSLGTGGTITSLPTNGTATIGDTYKVIKDGTYAGTSAKVGDTFICVTKTSSANTWTLIPSGDEPSGTVTSVKIQATSPIAVNSSSAITTSGTRTISHETSGVTANSYGDSSAQTPSFGGTFKALSATVNATGHVTAMGEHTVTIPSAVATTSTSGLMSSTDKSNLDNNRAVSEIRLTNEDLNNVTTVGFYYAGGGNTVTNKPTGYNNFGLEVIHNASGSQYTQIIYNEDGSYRRIKKANGTWTSWAEDKFTDTTYSFADGTNQFTVTPSGSTASTIKVTPQLKIDGITSDTTDKEINCYGECSTAAGTAAKVVSITKGTFALGAGSKVIVKFTNANTANNPTLNVNSKGAKNIFHNGARITTGTNKTLLAGTIEFVYDGTQFQLVGNYIDTDTTYSAGTGISFDGTTINHSNSVTAGTAKGDNSKTLAFGGTFTIPSVTYDSQGHVTAKGTTTMTMPSNPNTDTMVTQTNNTDDKYYRVLLSSTDNNNENTNTVNKSGEITVNPSTGRFRCKRFAVENNEAYTVYPIYVKLTGRDAATAGQDVKLMQVQYKTTNSGTDYTHTAYPIAVIGNNVGNTNNTGVRLGSVNGTTIVGAGESADDFATAQAKYNDENLYLTSDGRVYIYQGLSNAADSYSTKIQFPNQISGADSSITNGVATVAMQRSCLAGNDSAVDGTKRWYKVATWNILTTNTDVAAMIAVNNTYSNGVSGNENAGILHVHFRQNALGTHAHAALKFIANSGFNTQHFKLVWEYYLGTDLSVIGLSYSLYTYIDVRYMRRRFAFLSEGYRTNSIDYNSVFLSDSTTAEVEPTTSSGQWINGIYAS